MAAHQKKAARLRATLAFIDETGFFLAPFVRRTWAPVGQTPRLAQRMRHQQRASAIAALSLSPPRRRLGLYLEFRPEASLRQDDLVAFLRDLRRHQPGPVTVIWDRLAAHRSKRVRCWVERQRGFFLEFLPPTRRS